jgi:hypothetical protein
MRMLLVLTVGLAAGYCYGFRDAKAHRAPLQQRAAEVMVKRAGGASRERVRSDVDGQMRKAER